MSFISRIYGIGIKDFIEQVYKNYDEEEQYDFHAGRSCTDNVLCLKKVSRNNVSNMPTIRRFAESATIFL